MLRCKVSISAWVPQSHPFFQKTPSLVLTSQHLMGLFGREDFSADILVERRAANLSETGRERESNSFTATSADLAPPPHSENSRQLWLSQKLLWWNFKIQ